MRPDINYAAINLQCQQIAKRTTAIHMHSLLLTNPGFEEWIRLIRCVVAAHVSKRDSQYCLFGRSKLVQHAAVPNNRPGRDVLHHEAVTTNFTFVLVRIMSSCRR